MADMKIKARLLQSGLIEITPDRIAGEFAVHRDAMGATHLGRYYTVTHIPSGWAVAVSIKAMSRAVDLAERCNSVPQWKLLKPLGLRAKKGSCMAVKSTIPKSLRT